MASLHIQLLGDFRISTGDAPVPALDRIRLQLLLAYLLLHRHAPQPRQQIAFQFWPDSSERQARNNLRKALHQLRGAWPAVDQFLHVNAHTVQWRPDIDYTLDVAEFEDLVARAKTLTENPTAQQTALETAVGLYQGDLLSSGYDDWIIPERERLRQNYIEALESLVWLAEDQRDYGTAIHHASICCVMIRCTRLPTGGSCVCMRRVATVPPLCKSTIPALRCFSVSWASSPGRRPSRPMPACSNTRSQQCCGSSAEYTY